MKQQGHPQQAQAEAVKSPVEFISLIIRCENRPIRDPSDISDPETEG